MTLAAALAAAWIGLAAGGAHALSGPDHLAGVAPFAARSGRGAWRVGAAWGLGHAAGAGAAALVALALRARVPGAEELLSAWSETIVGVLLCVVGAVGLSRALRARARARHAVDGTHEHVSAAGHERGSAFGLGVFHGAAGLSHLFGVLPALGLPGTALPALYLAGYAVGSLACLAVFASGVGAWSSSGRATRHWNVVALASAASVVVGLVWIALPH